ncbi:MAG: uncharacterized protein HW380_479 [Magnetococcales bacterium]|nr:uncharacterized protein [Magnetococcales bacterium]
MRLSDIPIKQKLMFTIGFGLFLFCGVVLLYTLTLSRTIASYEHLLTYEMAIRQHTNQISIHVLQARKDEKDFLALKNPAFAQAAVEKVRQAIDAAREVERLAPETARGEEITQLLGLISHLEQYARYFQDIVSVWEEKGLDHEKGQQKRLRGSAHAMEHALFATDAEVVLANLEHLLRLTMTQMFASDPDGVSQIRDVVKTLRQSLQTKLDVSDSEQKMLSGLKGFAAIFERWVARGKVQGSSLSDLSRSHPGAILVRLIHYWEKQTVPGAQTAYLALRRHEKDYLLRHDESYLALLYSQADQLAVLLSQSSLSDAQKNDFHRHLATYREAMTTLASLDDRIEQMTESMRGVVHQTEPLTQKIGTIADGMAVDSAAKTRQFAEERASFIFIVCLVTVFCCGLLSYLIVRSIVSAIADLWHFSHQVAVGNLEAKTDLDSKDEIGQLAEVMREMVNRMRAMRLIADRMVMIMTLAARGAVPEHLHAQFQGDFHKMSDALNDMIQRLREFKVIADHVDRISRGEIPHKLDGPFQGDFKRMVDAINAIIDQLGAMGGLSPQERFTQLPTAGP